MVVENCSKSYDDKLIFENLSYNFLNKIYWLHGGNGIGKSVFLRCLTQVENFTTGNLKSDLKKILYIPEFHLNEDFLNLKENIELLFYFHNITVEKESLDDILVKLNILDYNILPNKASLGTNLKTSFSLLFINNHWDLIIIDESISHLDINIQTRIFEELEKRNLENTIIIFTYHGELNQLESNKNIVNLEIQKGGIVEW